MENYVVRHLMNEKGHDDMIDFLVGIFLGICGIFIVTSILGGGGGGGVYIRGTKEHDDYQESTNERLKNLSKNGITSSKEELLNWWNTHNPPK